MKITNTIAASFAVLTLLVTSALAADIVTKAPKKVEAAPTSCFDLAFGGGIQSDYNFRGGVATGQSKWCDATVIAKFAFDLTAMTNLK